MSDTKAVMRQALEDLDALVHMCEAHGDFSNGVTDATGAIDEGDVRASELIYAARCAITSLRDALAASAEPVAASALQGGMSNAELAAAFVAKLPGVKPTDGEMSAFAVGVEVGAARVAPAAPAAPAADEQAAWQAGTVTVRMTHEQVSALYLTLWHGRVGGKERPEVRPAFGWMEQPLVGIEKALEPVHSAIHDRRFNAMNRQFFGDDRLRFGEAPLTDADASKLAAAPAAPAAQALTLKEIRALPTVRAPEIDGEESDGTPRYWRSRPYVSLTKLEKLLRAHGIRQD